MIRSLTSAALLGSVVTLVLTGPAWAYLDPGTGSMMLQLLLGGVAGAMVVGKLYWQRLREFVRSLFSGNPGEAARATRATHASASSKADVRCTEVNK
jgi:hypothetical protein